MLSLEGNNNFTNNTATYGGFNFFLILDIKGIIYLNKFNRFIVKGINYFYNNSANDEKGG